MLWIVNWLLCCVCDFVEVKVDGQIIVVVVDVVFVMFDVDLVGFDLMDCKLLEVILYKFDGGLVGIDNFVVVIGEECDMIEDVFELYLIQQGFLQCMLCGCVVMLFMYCYFGLLVFDVCCFECDEWDIFDGK